MLCAVEEETWLKPSPQWLRFTLADYLVPAPPEGSDLSVSLIDELLRTVCLVEEPALSEETGNPEEASMIAAGGYFRLGALCGKAAI